MTLTLVAVVAVAAYVSFLVATSGQTFDPALDLDAGSDDAPASTPSPDPAATVPGDG